MTKVKTADLIGSALDWAVAHAESVPLKFSKAAGFWRRTDCPDIEEWRPSTDWSQGGQLVESYRVEINHMPHYVFAQVYAIDAAECGPPVAGPTPLIAACRAIVTAKLGDEVDIPEELFTPAAQ